MDKNKSNHGFPPTSARCAVFRGYSVGTTTIRKYRRVVQKTPARQIVDRAYSIFSSAISVPSGWGSSGKSTVYHARGSHQEDVLMARSDGPVSGCCFCHHVRPKQQPSSSFTHRTARKDDNLDIPRQGESTRDLDWTIHYYLSEFGPLG